MTVVGWLVDLCPKGMSIRVVRRECDDFALVTWTRERDGMRYCYMLSDNVVAAAADPYGTARLILEDVLRAFDGATPPDRQH